MLPSFNLANRVTLGRLVIAFVSSLILVLIAEGSCLDNHRTLAAWIGLGFFTLATVTDALDGYIARRDNTVTAFGRIADPFVDKIIVCGSLVLFLGFAETTYYLHPWMVALVLFREFLVTGIRGYMESKGIEFGAEMPGKIKMVVQSILVGFLFGVVAFAPDIPSWVNICTHICIWATVGLTLYSGALYVAQASKSFSAQDI
ncbi:MAG: CDP-diacylglycerol--glycerol-3-phosphate 3-phosphatidyltransferase [Planctomycetota bacterium]